MMPPTCTPLRKRCDYCGEEHVYRCAQLLLSRDPTNPDEACPGGTLGFASAAWTPSRSL